MHCIAGPLGPARGRQRPVLGTVGRDQVRRRHGDRRDRGQVRRAGREAGIGVAGTAPVPAGTRPCRGHAGGSDLRRSVVGFARSGTRRHSPGRRGACRRGARPADRPQRGNGRAWRRADPAGNAGPGAPQLPARTRARRQVPIKYRDEVERFARAHKLDFGHKPVVENTNIPVIPPLPELQVSIPLKPHFILRPYQQKGIAYGLEKKRFINGDDMGLGKTAQAIATIIAFGKFPVLVICPSAVKENWKRAIESISYKKAIVLQDSIKHTFPEFHRVGMADFFITNYESLKKYFVEDIKKPAKGRFRITDIVFKKKYLDLFQAVIVDEIHKVKDSKTQNYKFTRGITMGKEIVIGLTGTMVVNKPIDLVSQLTIINRLPEFGGYSTFKQNYCAGPKEASKLKELNYHLNTICYFRRNKSDPEIKAFLPDKSRQIVVCELSEFARKEYKHAQANLESYLSEVRGKSDDQIEKSMKGEVMVRIGILKNISARGKLADAFDFIHDLVSQGQKVVVFANLRDVIAQVQEKFPKSVRITGDENPIQKQAAVDRFKTDPNIQVIVCSIKAAGTGVDGLQDIASEVVFIEMGWHAAVMDQAEDRLYRTGQHKNVMCTYFIGKDTIDDWNYKLIESKRNIANTVTGAEDDVDVSFIDDVINLFTK